MRPIVFLFILINCIACRNPNSEKNTSAIALERLIAEENTNENFHKLISLREQLKKNDQLAKYYTAVASRTSNLQTYDLYVDSLRHFFKNDVNKRKYSKDFFEYQLLFADQLTRHGNVYGALKEYFSLLKSSSINPCDHAKIDNLIATLFEGQQDYGSAAYYYAHAYQQLTQCATEQNSSWFYRNQSYLTNAGFNHFLAGNLDSAKKYYAVLEQFLDKRQNQAVAKTDIYKQSYANLMDNLGGVAIREEKYREAEKFLKKCVALNTDISGGSDVAPLLKLAQVYTELGNLKMAEEYLKKVELQKEHLNSGRSYSKWLLVNTSYYQKKGDLNKALYYQQKHTELREREQDISQSLLQKNVLGELRLLQEKDKINTLTKEAIANRNYIISLIIFSVFVLATIFLFFRNFKATKRSHQRSILVNLQLQQNITQMERLNKKHVRIMQVIAHDLRNPISGINGAATMLLTEEDLMDDTKHGLKLIESTSKNAMQMVDDLAKTTLVSEEAPLEMQEICATTILTDVIKLMEHQAHEKDITIQVTGSMTKTKVNGNTEALWRAFTNLLSNAIKFSYRGAKIEITSTETEKDAIYSVKDFGIGIPKNKQKLVFDLFTEAKQQGTEGEKAFGLGLSITKKIVEQHEGKIWLESNNSGTCFFIRLPKFAQA